MRLAFPGGYAVNSTKPMFIVLLTPEEVAVYCVRNDNALFGSEAEWLEERRGELTSMRRDPQI
ncbi:hypothetical protein ACVI1N_000022 [Sinorhizobium medicae]